MYLKAVHILLFGLLTSSVIYAQDDKYKKAYDELATEVIILKLHLDSLNSSIENQNKYLAELDKKIRECTLDIYRITGLTEDEVFDYSNRLKEFESSINYDKEELLFLSSSKVRCLPDFEKRYLALLENKDIAALLQTGPVPQSSDTILTSNEKFYIIRSGDNLSKLSKVFLGDEGFWFLLYNRNRNIIKDPDIIYPGQIILLP